MFRKSSRALRRSFGLVIIFAMSYMIANIWQEFRNQLISVGQPKGRTNNNVRFIDEEIRTKENNLKFEKSDMKDEFEKPYKIIIWTREVGVPIYKSNPSICLGNVSCQITFDESDHSSAHAIVFKADSIDMDHLPSNR